MPQGNPAGYQDSMRYMQSVIGNQTPVEMPGLFDLLQASQPLNPSAQAFANPAIVEGEWDRRAREAWEGSEEWGVGGTDAGAELGQDVDLMKLLEGFEGLAGEEGGSRMPAPHLIQPQRLALPSSFAYAPGRGFSFRG